MGRFHWVTIVKVDEFPSAYLVDLLEAPYRRALGLSKAKQLSVPREAAKRK